MLPGLDDAAVLLEAKHIMMDKFIIDSGRPDCSCHTILSQIDIERAELRSAIDERTCRMLILGKVSLVGCRIIGRERLPYHGIIVKVHPEQTEIAAGIELKQVALRELLAVLHHGCRLHILVPTVLNSHITH